MQAPSARRLAKEAFVTGHAGTTLAEVSAIAAVPVACLLVLRCATGRALATAAAAPVLEWAAFVPALLACQLDLVSARTLLVAAALVAFGSQRLLPRPRPTRQLATPSQQLRDAVSQFRAGLLLITCAAILAVDFPAFPRRFAKAETFGTGLMDAGVGCFVLASAIPAGVSAAGRGAAKAHSSPLKEAARVGTLAALGLGRALATRSLDYQAHVGEYGAHWNFFLTVAVLRLANVALARCASSMAAAAALGAGLLSVHQWLLSGAGLIELAHSDGPRATLVAANKEGLLSLPGYLALHWLGVALGWWLHGTVVAGAAGGPGAAHGSRPATGPLLVRVAAADVALWLACWAGSEYVQPVSRRACNLAYVLWMLALGLQSVGLFMAAGRWSPGPLPRLLHSLNDGMLPAFLVANLLTGLVNLAVDTLAVGAAGAGAILLAYMAAVAASPSALNWLLQRLRVQAEQVSELIVLRLPLDL